MKYLLSFLLFFSLPAFAFNPGPDGVQFNKIEIYKAEKTVARKLSEKDNSPAENAELAKLQVILNTGKRAISWFEAINATRLPENKMDLTNKDTAKGNPITNPLKSSAQIMIDNYNKLLVDVDPKVISVVTSSSELPQSAPINDLDFIKAIRSINVVYQRTIRWIGSGGTQNDTSYRDLRGYYFLSNTPDLENKLTNWSANSIADQENFKTWLTGLCHNSIGKNICINELDQAIAQNAAYPFYQKYFNSGKAKYDSLFEIQETRPEIYWNPEKTKLIAPFLTPNRLDVKNWLAENIQDEWRGLNFNLLLNFKEEVKNIPHLEFESGVTPHVNDIGGDTITMDGDYAIGNYAERWTIRHEYGHVLGFVDCYVEFADVNEKAIIYYEVDIDNIMCSRHGHALPTHINELRRAYTKD
jgi:hypothetical protein